MAEDIGIELHDKIKAAFDARCGKDSTLSHIKRKIENGTATMEDTSIYARRMGELLRKSIESTTKPDDLPDGKMYYNIARSILEPLLRGNYDDINAICAEAQSALDAKKGIGLKPQKADFPAERIRAAIGGAAVKETAEHAIQVLGRTAENITGSFQTDYIKKNAEFRSKAGLSCYIERKDGFRCCDWCAGLAGRYRYPDEVPKDVYRRHDNCTCDVSYVSEKGRQNVHSKRWANEQAKAQRIEYAASLPKPMKLTRAEAMAKESEILAQRRLTYDAKRGIMLSTGKFYKVGDDPMFDVFGSAEESNPKELEELKHQMAEIGVNIVYHEAGGTLAYQGIKLGEPGTVSATKTASYSAWLHECQHAFDDKEAGWNSCYAAWDADEHIRREMRAYQKEIDLANSLGRNDIADKLISLRDKEISDIKKRDEMYAEIFKNDSND